METYIEDLAYDQKLLNVIGPKLLDEFLPNGSMDGLASMWGAKTPPAEVVLPPKHPGST